MLLLMQCIQNTYSLLWIQHGSPVHSIRNLIESGSKEGQLLGMQLKNALFPLVKVDHLWVGMFPSPLLSLPDV